ncbi:class I adenylate-forming enzyme family protein [Micromonospora humi]|uniref:Yersiniabactin salicyl-AMP ligase n=1 Tax=Micromonospora humi TaxID=745366 RepID=A0A1C5IC04_9ACTN|nr:AMP-binding protein [Micromonospora humi]SCG55569.1 yersiniabactin salicyl-AMP ligase [Micromonospora humi]
MSVLYDAVRQVAEERGDRVAVRAADGRETSYAALIRLVDRLTHGLSTVGVAPGDVVATRLTNSPGYVGLILALARSGAVHVPISVSAGPDSVDWSVGRSTPRLLVAEPGHAPPTRRVETVVLDDLLAGGAAPGAPSVPGGRAGLFRLLETTGSTGFPKLVGWRQVDLLADRVAWLSYLGITADDVFLTMHPLDVAHGADVHLFPALLAGARLVLSDPGAPPHHLLDDLDRSGATVFSALPRHYELLAGHGPRDLSRLRLPLCGGAYLSPEVITRARDRLGIRIRRIYGSTEFGIVLGNLDDVPQEDRGMRPLPGVEVSLEPLVAGAPEVGEILARSPHTSIGYHGDAAATAHAFQDGWYRTGDVAERTPSGEFRVLGRAADALAADGGGVRFAPQVEAALQACGPVGEAAVLPPLPGSEPFVVVTGVVGVDVAAVRSAAEGVLGEQGLAMPVRVVERIPHTPVGKLDKPLIRRRLG